MFACFLKKQIDLMSNFISLNIKHIRGGNRYDQTIFGKAIGVSRDAVSSYERSIALPSIETLQLISKRFNYTIDQLINIDLRIIPNPSLDVSGSDDASVSVIKVNDELLHFLEGYITKSLKPHIESVNLHNAIITKMKIKLDKLKNKG